MHSQSLLTHLSLHHGLEPLIKLHKWVSRQVTLQQPMLLITDTHVSNSSQVLCLFLDMLLLLLLLLLIV